MAKRQVIAQVIASLAGFLAVRVAASRLCRIFNAPARPAAEVQPNPVAAVV